MAPNLYNLERGGRYVHPKWGELIFVRMYRYRGVRWQFRTCNLRWLVNYSHDEIEGLRHGTPDATA